MKGKLKQLLALAAVIAVIMPTAAAQAAAFNLTTSPLPVDLTTKPGGTVTTPIKVENTGSEAVQVKVSLMQFTADGTSGKPQIVQPKPNDPSLKWVSFSETSFDAEPNVWHTITMTIHAPTSAAFGYYYAVVFSEAGAKPTATGQHDVINGAVATLVLLDVQAPGEKRTLTVTGFKATKKLYDYLPATFLVTVKNTGNVHAIPEGDIFITKGKTQLAAIPLNQTEGNILPGTERTFTVQWNDGFPRYTAKRVNGQLVSDKQGQPVQQLDWSGTNLSKLRLGSYTAHLTLTYNNGTRDVPVDGQLAFWVVPWKLLLIGLVVFLLALFGLYSAGRSLQRRVHKARGKA